MNTEEEKRQPRSLELLRATNRNFSTCGRCGLPWNHCVSKSIDTSGDGTGCFAICQYCWDISSLEERLHHFKNLWYQHKNRYNHVWDWEYAKKEIIKQSI